MTAPSPYLSKQYRDGIYIPAGLIIAGCLIVKKEWLPFAVALAAALSGYKFWSMRKYTECLRRSPARTVVVGITVNRVLRRPKGSEA